MAVSAAASGQFALMQSQFLLPWLDALGSINVKALPGACQDQNVKPLSYFKGPVLFTTRARSSQMPGRQGVPQGKYVWLSIKAKVRWNTLWRCLKYKAHGVQLWISASLFDITELGQLVLFLWSNSIQIIRLRCCYQAFINLPFQKQDHNINSLSGLF